MRQSLCTQSTTQKRVHTRVYIQCTTHVCNQIWSLTHIVRSPIQAVQVTIQCVIKLKIKKLRPDFENSTSFQTVTNTLPVSALKPACCSRTLKWPLTSGALMNFGCEYVFYVWFNKSLTHYEVPPFSALDAEVECNCWVYAGSLFFFFELCMQ